MLNVSSPGVHCKHMFGPCCLMLQGHVLLSLVLPLQSSAPRCRVCQLGWARRQACGSALSGHLGERSHCFPVPASMLCVCGLVGAAGHHFPPAPVLPPPSLPALPPGLIPLPQTAAICSDCSPAPSTCSHSTTWTTCEEGIRGTHYLLKTLMTPIISGRA